jgi:peptidoglycan hydrolase-like protein with peptidoglycan-binding domain
MAWHLAPSLVQLRNEVNARWPRRPKGSDGTVGDTSHSARKSDHNPNARNSVNAFDITYPGVDPKVIIAAVSKHPAGNYVIFNRKIYSRSNGWKAEPYSGASPHTEHLHVSILQSVAAEQSKAKWLSAAPVRPVRKPLPAYPGKSAFQVRDTGEHIKVLQRGVGNRVTGVMSVADKNKVKSFQRVRPLLWPADGVVGPKTYKALASTKANKLIYK